jgi:aryl-alcohol dehydrogenase-like predicted oxidoreductase
MRMRTLGRSGLLVSELSLGAMIFGEEGPRGTAEKVAGGMIRRFLDAGGNFIDTADVYADGRSETIVGKALRGRRDEVVLATKVRGRTGPGPNDVGLSRRHVLHGVHASLKRLGTDWIDVLYLHLWDPVTPLEETLGAVDHLVRLGAVRYLGISNFAAWQAAKTIVLARERGWPVPIAGQYQYSLLARDIEDEFDGLCVSEGLALVPWGPLGGGFLTGKYRADQPPQGRVAAMPDKAEEAWERRAVPRTWRVLEKVEAIAAETGTSASQVALAWLRAKPTVASVILGARTPEQLADNLAAADLDLTPGQIARLDAVSALPERYPYRMQVEYGARDDVVTAPAAATRLEDLVPGPP